VDLLLPGWISDAGPPAVVEPSTTPTEDDSGCEVGAVIVVSPGMTTGGFKVNRLSPDIVEE
jgi:hypothetical protein